MKIALPVEGNSLEAKICQSFGRAPLYLFYNTEDGAKEFKENSAATSLGGAGIKAAQLIVDEKAEAVLAPRCGENAAKVLGEGGVRVYRTIGDSIEDNIAAYEAGKLEVLADIHPGYHRRG